MAMYITSAGGEKNRSLQGQEMHTQYDLVIGKYREGELRNRISAARLYVFLPEIVTRYRLKHKEVPNDMKCQLTEAHSLERRTKHALYQIINRQYAGTRHSSKYIRAGTIKQCLNPISLNDLPPSIKGRLILHSLPIHQQSVPSFKGTFNFPLPKSSSSVSSPYPGDMPPIPQQS